MPTKSLKFFVPGTKITNGIVNATVVSVYLTNDQDIMYKVQDEHGFFHVTNDDGYTEVYTLEVGSVVCFDLVQGIPTLPRWNARTWRKVKAIYEDGRVIVEAVTGLTFGLEQVVKKSIIKWDTLKVREPSSNIEDF